MILKIFPLVYQECSYETLYVIGVVSGDVNVIGLNSST